MIIGVISPLRSKSQLTGEQTAQACDIAWFRQLSFSDKVAMQKEKGETFSFRGDAMRYVTAFCLFALLSGHRSEAQALPTSSAQNAEQPISVVVQPEAEYLGAVRVSITNHSKHKVWFESCPDAFTVELTDSNGRIVPYKLPQPPAGQTWECGMNIIYTILPGKTWTTQVAISEKFDLEAGTYSLRVRWHFPWNGRKTDQGANWDTLTVSSNTISLTITR